MNVSRPGWTIAAVKFEAPAAFYHPSEVTTGDMRCASFTLESAASAAATRKVAAQETEAAKKAYLFIYYTGGITMLDESMIPYVPRKQSTHFFSHASQFQWLELPVVPSIDSNRLHPCIEMPAKLRQHTTCRQMM